MRSCVISHSSSMPHSSSTGPSRNAAPRPDSFAWGVGEHLLPVGPAREEVRVPPDAAGVQRLLLGLRDLRQDLLVEAEDRPRDDRGAQRLHDGEGGEDRDGDPQRGGQRLAAPPQGPAARPRPRRARSTRRGRWRGGTRAPRPRRSSRGQPGSSHHRVSSLSRPETSSSLRVSHQRRGLEPGDQEWRQSLQDQFVVVRGVTCANSLSASVPARVVGKRPHHEVQAPRELLARQVRQRPQERLLVARDHLRVLRVQETGG